MKANGIGRKYYIWSGKGKPRKGSGLWEVKRLIKTKRLTVKYGKAERWVYAIREDDVWQTIYGYLGLCREIDKYLTIPKYVVEEGVLDD